MAAKRGRASGRGWRVLVAGTALGLFCSAALAEIVTKIVQHDHVVEGSTAAGLVRSMNGNPVQGDHGHAYASIHPNYSLMVDTSQAGSMCRARVRVRLSFDLTLPRAANPGSMSARTRSAWNGFVAFARAHEAHHLASYTGCARSFVASAERMRNAQCLALQGQIRTAFNAMKKDCEARQLAFDRAEAPRLARLSLFAMARAERRSRR